MALVTAGVLTVTGCGVDGTTTDAESPGPTTSPGAGSTPRTATSTETPEPTVPDELQPEHRRLSPAPSPPARPPATGQVPRDILTRVVEDAAELAGVAPERVEVIRAEAVQWNDGSWGCPEPGQHYTQAIVDGYWVELRAGGEHFDYRLNERGVFRLCEQPFRAPAPPPSLPDR